MINIYAETYIYFEKPDLRVAAIEYEIASNLIYGTVLLCHGVQSHRTTIYIRLDVPSEVLDRLRGLPPLLRRIADDVVGVVRRYVGEANVQVAVYNLTGALGENRLYLSNDGTRPVPRRRS